jgi:hypothetical protein
MASVVFASASATCSIPPSLSSVSEIALSVYDYLVNHPEEITDDLNDLGDDDEFVENISSYLSLDRGVLQISYSTGEVSEESGTGPINSSSAVFDFLSSHFSCLQTSLFMRVVWIVGDTKSFSAGVDYYDRSGQMIDVDFALNSFLSC